MLDALVVGAGPAGSACALRLAAQGRAVSILERSAFPRTKVCGEYLNSGALAELAALGCNPMDGANEIRGIRLHAHGVIADLPFSVPAAAIARADLDARLLAKAQAAGATLISGRAERLARMAGGWSVTYRDSAGAERMLESRIVVGADGAGSFVARACGLTKPSQRPARFALGGHYLGLRSTSGYIEMYVRGKTYFAVNPLQNGLSNVMVIVDEKTLHAWSGDVEAHLRATTRELAGDERSLEHAVLAGKRVSVGPLAHSARHAALAGLYLIGDAAGFIDPFTGQGVFVALRTAELAANAVADELSGAPDAYRSYRRAHARLISGRRRLAGFVALLLAYPWLARLAARRLQASPGLRAGLMRAVAGS